MLPQVDSRHFLSDDILWLSLALRNPPGILPCVRAFAIFLHAHPDSPEGKLMKDKIIPLITGLRRHSILSMLKFSHPDSNRCLLFTDFESTDSLFDAVLIKSVDLIVS